MILHVRCNSWILNEGVAVAKSHMDFIAIPEKYLTIAGASRRHI
jgi:hypothetical protein